MAGGFSQRQRAINVARREKYVCPLCDYESTIRRLWDLRRTSVANRTRIDRYAHSPSISYDVLNRPLEAQFKLFYVIQTADV